MLKPKSTYKSILKLLLFLLDLVFASCVNPLRGNQLLLAISGLSQTSAGTSIPISHPQFPLEEEETYKILS